MLDESSRLLLIRKVKKKKPIYFFTTIKWKESAVYDPKGKLEMLNLSEKLRTDAKTVPEREFLCVLICGKTRQMFKHFVFELENLIKVAA